MIALGPIGGGNHYRYVGLAASGSNEAWEGGLRKDQWGRHRLCPKHDPPANMWPVDIDVVVGICT